MKNKNLSSLEEKLGYKFNNIGLLNSALIHSSYANENNLKIDNEKMEFLGDSVIHLVVTEFLFKNYPNETEGVLSALRSYCESEPFLSEQASKLNLGDFISFGVGEERSGGKYKKSLLADCFEAVMAAIYLDSSYKKSSKSILALFEEDICEVYSKKLFLDSKSELQKYSQKYFNIAPSYELISEEGRDHEKQFTVKVVVLDKSSYGKGSTKKEAEKEAALNLYSILNEL